MDGAQHGRGNGVYEHRAAPVFDQAAEGDDLDDVVLAVFAHDIIDDLSSALGTEVDIKIGHAYAVGVEEALKNQVVFYRVYLRDTDAVGAQRTCTRTSAGADGNAV